MRETFSTKKVCSFYVSNMHFATMILPFANKQLEEKTKIITFLENNFTTNIELVLSKLITSEERKKELLNINWKDTKIIKYMNIERLLKNKLENNSKNLIIVNGNEEYINDINNCIQRYFQKNYKKTGIDSVKIINFYEVRKFQRKYKRDIRQT